MKNLPSLVVFAALVAAAAWTGSTFMPGEWYAGLAKPSFTPPNWLFPVAWTILYIMIAIAGWLAWQAGGMSSAVSIWGLALILNALWSYLMFGRHEIGLALADIVVLWIAIAAFIVASWPRDRRAALLFVPYLLWVSFAALLNFEVWRLNPGA